MKIPLTKPAWGKAEERAVVVALRTTSGAGDGPYTQKLVQKLQKLTGCRFAYPTPSCTHGLELILASLGVGPGDEVITPSFTMTSTANCIVLTGAKPIFADIDPVTYCISPLEIEKLVTKRTKAVMVVHYAGMPAAMEQILVIARKYNLFVVEDAAHALGASFRGRPLGTFGIAGAFSFHGTKNVSCGEGGAVVTNDKRLAEKMEIYRANGTNRNAFLRGAVSRYRWVGKGSSYLLSDILTSIVITQLSQIKSIINKRIQIASLYTKTLLPYKKLIQLPVVPSGTVPNWHIYALRFRTKDQCQTFIRQMRASDIEVSTHYVPLHSSPMGKTLGGGKYNLPVTDNVSETLVRLPIYPGLTKTQFKYILTSAQRILEKFQ